MEEHLDSVASEDGREERQQLAAWVKVTAIAAASALAGGLAAAWIYRKTLLKLQNAAEDAKNTKFHRPHERADEEF